jgi:hypothetical protein
MDHIEPYFFRDSPDTDLGYLFADLLSQYLLCRHLHLHHPKVKWALTAVKCMGVTK